jgi:hypothetical protein
MRNAGQLTNGGSAPATPGFNAVAPEWQRCFAIGGSAPKPRARTANARGWGDGQSASPTIPAAEPTLGSHPCVALSSAQVLSEWINRNLAGNALAANGDNPLNFVSHPRGSLQSDAWRPHAPISAAPLNPRAVFALASRSNLSSRLRAIKIEPMIEKVAMAHDHASWATINRSPNLAPSA